MEPTENLDNAEDIVQTKENDQEIEKKVARILKLIKSNGQDKKGKIPDDSRRKSELIGLIHDFHKQYQSLYVQYDNLSGEMDTRVRGGRKEKENPSSAQTSDSEYYSSEDIENGVLTNRHNRSSESIKAELDTENSEASDNLKYMTAFGKSPKGETIRRDQKNKVQERKREFSTLVHGSQASAEIKELEGQLTMLRMELESLRSLKNDLEEKETQVKELGETNAQLQTRVSELELMSEEKGNEISSMTLKMKENENNLTSRITQVKDLQWEIDYLRAEIAEMEGSKKNKKSTQVLGLKDQFKTMQQELESLRREKAEMKLQLDMKTKEVTGNLSQIEALKDEIARKKVQEQGLLKEKEGFIAQMDDLKLEVNSLHDQNNELEEMIRSQNKEMDELRKEKEKEKKKNEAEENDVSTQIVALKEQVNSLQGELVSLAREKSKLEEHNEKLKQNSVQNLMQVENEILNLTSKIEDQEKTLKEKEDTIKKFTEESKLVKHLSLDSQKQRPAFDSPRYRSMDSAKLNHNVLERKIDELAEKFQMKTENHIRLLSRRIRVAEQLHSESKDSYKKVLEKLEEDNKELNEQKTACESEVKTMKDMLLESGGKMLSGLDTMIKKVDEENGNFLNRISRISSELQVARNCLTKKNDEVKKQMNYNLETEEVSDRDRGLARDELNVAASEVDKNGEDLQQKLKERNEVLTSPGDLETEEVSNRDRGLTGDELNVADRKVEDLEQKLKERDEVLSSLGEEKREAIKQLCVLIEYHRQRYDHLKEAVSKMPIRFKKPT